MLRKEDALPVIAVVPQPVIEIPAGSATASSSAGRLVVDVLSVAGVPAEPTVEEWYCWPNGDPLIETSAAGLAELEARLA